MLLTYIGVWLLGFLSGFYFARRIDMYVKENKKS
jgi:hypothetical protein